MIKKLKQVLNDHKAMQTFREHCGETITYKGRKIVEGVSPNGERILHFYENSQEYGLAFQSEEGKKIALDALQFDIDRL